MPESILAGMRVLDFGRYIAAPLTCQILADMGAEVIRVERPGGEGDRERSPHASSGQSLYFSTLNRNKKGITLNLADPRGRALLRDLATHADVLVHNLPVSRAQTMGLSWDGLHAANPRLVLLAVSGFGSDGPYANYSAFDGVLQAMSGAMSVTGPEGGPAVLAGIPFMDFGTGVYGALSVALALLHRERTGQGQHIDLSLFGTGLSYVTSYGLLAEASVNQVVRTPVGNTLIYGVGGSFPTRDGFVVIQTLTNPLWERLCQTIGRPDLLSTPGLSNDMERFEHRDVIRPIITAWTQQRTRDEAMRILGSAGIPVGKVLSADEVLADVQTNATNLIRHIQQPGVGSLPVNLPPMKFSATPASVNRPAPGVGEHNAQTYKEVLGLTDRQLAELVEQKII